MLSRYPVGRSLGAPNSRKSDVGNISCSEQPLVQSEKLSLSKVTGYENTGVDLRRAAGVCCFAHCFQGRGPSC
jgi:hypothetical protein